MSELGCFMWSLAFCVISFDNAITLISSYTAPYYSQMWNEVQWNATDTTGLDTDAEWNRVWAQMNKNIIPNKKCIIFTLLYLRPIISHFFLTHWTLGDIAVTSNVKFFKCSVISWTLSVNLTEDECCRTSLTQVNISSGNDLVSLHNKS